MRHMPRVCRYSLTLVAAAALAGVASAAAPSTYDPNAGTWLANSVWAFVNRVETTSCTGTGAAVKIPTGTAHRTFQCRVTSGSKSGVVLVKSLGPEWLQVTKVVSGGFKPDPGIGKVPAAKPILDSTDAASALADSSWASANDVSDGQCNGVGATKELNDYTDLFGAFTCRTIGVFGQQLEVLVVFSGPKSLKVVKTWKR